MIERYDVTPRSERWFELRSPDLTASELGAVAGVDPWKTPYQVWAEKAGLAAAVEQTAAMRFGIWAEPAVVCAARDTRPELDIRYPLDLYLRDPENRLGGTPDGDGFDDGEPVAFEFKVISKQSFDHEWPDGVPPLRYQLQVAANTMLLDAHHGVLAALVMGWSSADLHVVRIGRHVGAEAGIIRLARSFWQAFDEGHALVAPDYARDADTLRQVFRPDSAKPAPIDLSADNLLPGLLEERAMRKAEIKADEDRCAAIDAEIIHKMNGSEAATLPGWKISHKMAHRAAYQVAAKDYPTLRISKGKE